MAEPEQVERFKAEAGQLGVAVYVAAGAAEVVGYLLGLIREREVKNVVASRSPLLEAMALRRQMEEHGITVTRTDLREWLADRAWQSTGIAATTEMERLAMALAEETGNEVQPAPGTLARVAQRVLRQSCVAADMGVSEASIGIASTGTAVLVGNAGDERLVAVLPRIHVTLLNTANLVSSVDEATAKLRLLANSIADGKMPAYVTYITGRNTTGDIPGALMARAQGPEEEHVVAVGWEVSP